MKKKINIVISSLRGGGAERVCVTIANSLIDNGYDVDLLVVNLKDSIFQKDLNSKVKLYNMNKNHIRNTIKELYKFSVLRKNEVVVVFNYEIACILLILRKMFKLKIRIVCRSINTISKDISKVKGAKKLAMSLSIKLIRYMDVIIAQSTGMKEDLVNNCKVNNDKIYVINNPINEEIYNYRRRNKIIINENLKENEKYIVFVGRLANQKGLFMLLDAYKLCRERGVKNKLKIVGKGPLEEELYNYAREIGISNYIIIEDFKENISEVFLNAKFTVLSSYYEGFPNVLVESIALGIPIVSFDCPSGPKDIVKENINGYLVKYLDIIDLADKMLKATLTNWNYRAIMETAEKFEIKVIIKKYIEIINLNNSKKYKE